MNENTYKYTKQEKIILKDLKLDEIEGLIDVDKNNDDSKNSSKVEEYSKLEINEVSMTSIDKLSFRRSKSKLKSNILNFEFN